jgi:DNA-binding response OmpR family regulator
MTLGGATEQDCVPGNGPGRRVLLVEDEPLVAILASDKLTQLGFEVVEAATARAALNHAGNNSAQFEFAVVDFGLPDCPGEELIADLKALRPDLPIIVASGYAETMLRSLIKAGGRFAFLNKPYDIASLQAAIDDVMRG